MPETFAPSNKNMSFASAEVLFDQFDDAGASTGFLHMGELTDLGFLPTDDIKEHYEHMTTARGLYDSALAQRKVEGNMTVWELNNPNFALILSGTSRLFNQTGATITAEQLNATLQLGKTYQTAERNISAVTIKQGATTLVLNTDYEIVDASAGLIRILPTSATAVEGSPVTADYTSAAITDLKTISPYDKPQVDGALLILERAIRGPAREHHMWHVAFSPKELTNLIGDDYRSAGLTFKWYNDVNGDFGGSADYPYGISFERS